MDRDAWDRYTSDKASWEYDIIAPGFKANLPDILSAIGRVQLKKAESFEFKRKKIVEKYNKAFSDCDFLTLHVPLTDKTKDMINAREISLMKNGVRIINYARGAVVNEDAIIEALNSGKVAKYVADFPTERLIKCKNTVLTPHLGGTTGEAEAGCARMAAQEIDDYLKNGKIVR